MCCKPCPEVKYQEKPGFEDLLRKQAARRRLRGIFTLESDWRYCRMSRVPSDPCLEDTARYGSTQHQARSACRRCIDTTDTSGCSMSSYSSKQSKAERSIGSMPCALADLLRSQKTPKAETEGASELNEVQFSGFSNLIYFAGYAMKGSCSVTTETDAASSPARHQL